MSNYTVFFNDGNNFAVSAETEEEAREKMVETAIAGNTSIRGVAKYDEDGERK